MQEMTGTAWKRRGSSVIFDGRLIGEFVGKDAMVSLQEALNWVGNWPDEVPGGGQTVLICGLEAAIELIGPAEAENFLRCKIKPLIQEFQIRWDAVGLVFGFGCSPNRFRLGTFEDVLFKCPGGNEIKLSGSLWNGSAKKDMCQILVEDNGKQSPGGYYVKRLS